MTVIDQAGCPSFIRQCGAKLLEGAVSNLGFEAKFALERIAGSPAGTGVRGRVRHLQYAGLICSERALADIMKAILHQS